MSLDQSPYVLVQTRQPPRGWASSDRAILTVSGCPQNSKEFGVWVSEWYYCKRNEI